MADRKGDGEPVILSKPISADEAAKKQLSAITGRLQKAPDKLMPGSDNEWVVVENNCNCVIL